MKISTARELFALRFYKWAVADARREIENDFPLLRGIKSDHNYRFLAFMWSLSSVNERIKYHSARLRRGFSDCAKLAGEEVSEDDKTLVSEMRNKIVMLLPPEHIVKAARKINRSVLRKKLKAEIAQNLGTLVRPTGATEWDFVTPVNGWVVETNVDTGGSFQIQYSHIIRWGGEERPGKGTWISEWPKRGLSWLLTATWDDLASSEDEIVKSFSACCSHFLKALPELLDGLVLDEDEVRSRGIEYESFEEIASRRPLTPDEEKAWHCKKLSDAGKSWLVPNYEKKQEAKRQDEESKGTTL